jgi:hypothetical protein
MRRSFDAATVERLKQWFGSFDVVVPRSNLENIERQWKSCFDDDRLWDTMVEGVKQSQLFRTRPNYIYFQMEICYFANMYIMRADLLDEYLAFCFDVLGFCGSRFTMRDRALGYFSERLFSFWLFQKRIETPTLRVLELPLIMFSPPGETGPHLAARPLP